MPIVLKVPVYDTWKQIAKNLELKCNFPHCIGTVDGKHVVLQVTFFIFFISFLFIYFLQNIFIFKNIILGTTKLWFYFL